MNFWELNYIAYILGFLFVPRITIVLIFKNYVTGSFDWSIFLVSLTIWWKFPGLALGGWSKLGFSLSMGLFPRLLLGIIGYNYLSPDNHFVMLVFCVIGAIIDIFMKVIRGYLSEGGEGEA